MNASEEYNELLFYTLSHPDPEFFIHQYVVDAFAAQTANENSKTIRVLYALAGLYLAVEKGYSGKDVQNAHIVFSKDISNMPRVNLPAGRGAITIKEVMNEAPGIARDEMIIKWCASVWQTYHDNRDTIIGFCLRHLE